MSFIQCNSFVTNVISEDTEGDIFPEIFPPFPPNLDKRQDIKAMDIISNLEVMKDLEFDHQYINVMSEKFSLTPTKLQKIV